MTISAKQNAWRTPEELLVEYMDHILKQEYEEMYAMLHIEASGNVSQEDFVKRKQSKCLVVGWSKIKINIQNL